MTDKLATRARRQPALESPREQLLAGIPVTERRLELAGVSTAVLEGGEGPPVLLLHGPGGYAAMWQQVIPAIAATHRVVAPDLPGHGTSTVPERGLDAETVLSWLGELIDETCPAPPVLVGQLVGGAVAARFAADHGDRLERLVLVVPFGLAPFQPIAGVRRCADGLSLRADGGLARRALESMRLRPRGVATSAVRSLGADEGVQPRPCLGRGGRYRSRS